MRSGDVICPICGEVEGGYFDVRGAKLHIPKECRCKREAREQAEAERKADLDKRRAENRKAAIADSMARITGDVPEPHRDLPLDKRLLPFVERFTGKEWLYMDGPIGTGKTTQAWCVALELAKRGHLLVPSDNDVGWGILPFTAWDVVSWLGALRDSYDNDKPEPDLVYPRLLILDDMGAERIRRDSDGDSWVREQFHMVLHQRWLKRKPTIITSNLKPSQVGARLDERIADRIFDKRLTTVVTLTGESFRRKG